MHPLYQNSPANALFATLCGFGSSLYSTSATAPKTVNIYTGKTTLVGTALIQPKSGDATKLEITINLVNYAFQVSGSVHVQGYVDAPSGNPNPGGFENTIPVSGGTTVTFTVNRDGFNFWAIHMMVHMTTLP